MHTPSDWNPPDWYRFVLDEAALLDARGFVEWVALFAADGRYWMPASVDARPEANALALFDETPEILMLRAQRLLHPLTHVQVPASRTHHHVSGLRLRSDAPELLCVGSMQSIVEQRAGVQRHFSARVEHHLRPTPQGLKMVLKRVDLLDSDSAHRALAFPL